MNLTYASATITEGMDSNGDFGKTTHNRSGLRPRHAEARSCEGQAEMGKRLSLGERSEERKSQRSALTIGGRETSEPRLNPAQQSLNSLQQKVNPTHQIRQSFSNRLRFEKIAQPGFHLFNPFSGAWLAGRLRQDQLSRFASRPKPSEYAVLPVGCVAKINPLAPLNKVCVLSCGISTGFGAAVNISKSTKGSTVAVFGLGVVGLAAAEGARVSGASRIIGVNLNPNRFEQERGRVSGASRIVGVDLNPSRFEQGIMRNKAKKGVEVETQEAVNRCNLQAVIGLVKDYPLRDAHRLALKKTPFWPLIEAVVEKKLVSNHCRKRENVVEKIIHSYDPESKTFNLSGKKVRMTKDDVRLIFGISCGNKQFPKGTWNKATVGLSTKWKIPADGLKLTKIKTLLQRFIEGDNQNDIDHVARLVSLFLCGSLFFANTGTNVKWVYVHCMEDLEKVKEYDWAGAVTDYLLKSIHKEHQNPKKVKGCTLLLMYYLCEHTNIIDQQNAEAIPRLLKWDISKLWKSLKDIKELEHLLVDQVNDGVLEETTGERNIYNMQLAEAAPEKLQPSLSEELRISQRENSSANQKISSFNDMYMQMQEYNTRLQEENSKLQSELATTNETLKRVEKEKATVVENLSTLRGHYTSLQDQLTTSLISSHDMYMQMQEYNTRLQEENSRLQSELATTNETLKRVEKEKAAVIENLSTLRGHYTSLQDQLTTSRISSHDMYMQMQEYNTRLQEENSRLQSELATTNETIKLVEKEKAALQDQLTKSRISLYEAGKQKTALVDEVVRADLQQLREDSDGRLSQAQASAEVFKCKKFLTELDSLLLKSNELEVSQDEAVKQKEALVDEVRRLSLEQVREDGDDRLSQVQPLARKSLVELDPLTLKTNELEICVSSRADTNSTRSTCDHKEEIAVGLLVQPLYGPVSPLSAPSGGRSVEL
ncbi:hypothetical protein Vadar_005150 [Vaccinium darrowii]|uniref:Uncharacterized protein n=1 Tax=Vaccinium darrowii TaxID=229202 RepID=A0ACB7Z257_9ERIC|nr:hypothetical protein Vadar_005150 [Vaccinium darrowii]